MSPKTTILLLAAVFCMLSVSNAATRTNVSKERLQQRLCALDDRYCPEDAADTTKARDEMIDEDDDDDDDNDDEENTDAANTDNELGENKYDNEDATDGAFEQRSRRRITTRRRGRGGKTRRNRKVRINKRRSGRKGKNGKRGGKKTIRRTNRG